MPRSPLAPARRNTRQFEDRPLRPTVLGAFELVARNRRRRPLEALRDAWLSAGDLAAQKQIAEDIQRQAFVDVPYIPLGQILPTWAYQRTITDVLTGYALFWQVRKV